MGWLYRFAVVCALLALLGSCAPTGPLRIGFVGTLSGSASELGVSGRRGAELAVRVINEGGGIRRRPVELLAYDDRNDPTGAEALVRRMAADGVVALIGPMTSNVGIPLAEKTNAAELVAVSPTVSFAGLFGVDDFFFIMVPSNVRDGEHLAGVAWSRGLRRVAVMGDATNRDYVEVYAGAFTRKLGELGGEAAALRLYDPKDRSRAKDLVAEVLAAGPDALLTITGSADTAVVVQEAGRLRPDMPVLTNPWSMTSDLIAGTGSFGRNLIIQGLYDPYDERAPFKEFAARYAGLFGAEPGFGAVYSYNAAMAVFEALSAAKGNGDPRTLKAALLERTVTSGCGDRFGFSATGESETPLYAFTIGDGKFRKLE